jgi:serine phosphatase RsbU (regulator of sigma subunit)
MSMIRVRAGTDRRTRSSAGTGLIHPLPPSVAGLNLAAAQLPADRGATVGGDLYEVIATEHGVRLVMGDVRGHGPAAVGTASAVLGGFREAVHDEARLTGVLRRLDRALARHLRGRGPQHPVMEDFVTVLLLEIAVDGRMHAVNCGHPWPYRLSAGGVARLSRADPLPPLGPFPLPADPAPAPLGRLLPGETLVLYTDGVEDARDARGRFLPPDSGAHRGRGERPDLPSDRSAYRLHATPAAQRGTADGRRGSMRPTKRPGPLDVRESGSGTWL